MRWGCGISDPKTRSKLEKINRTCDQFDDFIDIGVNIMIPKHASRINLAYKDSLFSLDSNRFGGNLGFRFAKIFPFSRVSPRNNIEWHSGFGVAALFYDANHKRYFDILNDKYKKDTDETYDFVLATIFLSQGIKLNIKNVGIMSAIYCLDFNCFVVGVGELQNMSEPK